MSRVEVIPTTISVHEAARLVGRSQTWIRNLVSLGVIDSVGYVGRRQVLSLDSVQKVRPRRLNRPRLRLVVDNTVQK